MKKNKHTITSASSQNAWSLLARIIGKLSKLAAVIGIPLFLFVLIAYVVGVVYIRNDIKDKGIAITQATGSAPEYVTMLGGWLPWLFGAALIPMIIGLVVDAFNPFSDSRKVFKKLFVAALFVIGITSINPLSRWIRNVDSSGLPVEMAASNPSTARWFAPNGTAVLFVSGNPDGTCEYWNRPGTTPMRGTQSRPVTSEDRVLWEAGNKKKAEIDSRKKAAAAEHLRKEREQRAQEQRNRQTAQEELARKSRETTLLKVIEDERRRHTEEKKRLVRKAQEKRQPAPVVTRPVDTPPPGASLPPKQKSASTPARRAAYGSGLLVPGRIVNLRAKGRATSVWCDGAVSISADGGGWRTLPAGHKLYFSHHGEIHIRPLERRSYQFHYQFKSPPNSADGELMRRVSKHLR